MFLGEIGEDAHGAALVGTAAFDEGDLPVKGRIEARAQAGAHGHADYSIAHSAEQAFGVTGEGADGEFEVTV